tara:strand:+ start:1895 stop:2101 length:207 start_codon:yes stop_codon:yes gene_type:complete
MTTKTKKTSGFKKGSGCFKCVCCEKLTRITGRTDNESVQVCDSCYEACEEENFLSDTGKTTEEFVNSL